MSFRLLKFSAFICLAFSWLTVGCASKPKVTCDHLDWFEIGRQQGIAGQNLKTFAPELKACSASTENSVSQIRSGYQAGLQSFCTDFNYFQMGRQQLAIPGNCPKEMKDSLVKSYNKGQQLNSIEAERLKIELELSRLRQDSTRSPASQTMGVETVARNLEKRIRTYSQKIEVLKKEFSDRSF